MINMIHTYDIVKEKNKGVQDFALDKKFSLLSMTASPQENADCFLLKSGKDFRKEIQNARRKFDLVIVQGNISKNREILEASPDVLLSPHLGAGKDFMKERNAGLDSPSFKIAAANKVAIGIDLSEILHANDREREAVIGRMMQNIRLCRKYKVRMLLASFASSVLEMRSPLDLESFAQALGMTSKEAQDALHEAGKILARNSGKRDASYVSEGIRVIE